MTFVVDLRQVSNAAERLLAIGHDLQARGRDTLDPPHADLGKEPDVGNMCTTPAGAPVAGPLPAAVNTWVHQMYGSLNLMVVVVSCLPAFLAKRAAERFDLGRVRLWLAVLTLFGVASVVLRAYEFPALNCRWDDNAYASITWVLLGLHSTHVVTDVADSAVLLALMITGPIEEKRFVDVSENSLYWYFIVIWWLPIYLTVYFAPRWL